jgi:hypothetical protein
MEKIEIFKKPFQIVEYMKGVYHPDPIESEESFPFTIEVIKIPHAQDDISLGEITWEEATPPLELLAEEKIKDNFFDTKWKTQ